MCPHTTRAIQVTMQEMSRELDFLRAERQRSESDAAMGGGGGGGRSARCGDDEGAGKEKEQELAVEAGDKRDHNVHETRECQQGQEQRQRLHWMDARQLGQQGGGVTLLAGGWGVDVEPLSKPEGIGQVNAAAGEAEERVEERGGGRARSHGGVHAGHANREGVMGGTERAAEYCERERAGVLQVSYIPYSPPPSPRHFFLQACVSSRSTRFSQHTQRQTTHTHASGGGRERDMGNRAQGGKRSTATTSPRSSPP
jgi:hypothetical protein